MSQSFEDIATALNKAVDGLEAYVESAVMAPRTRGKLREEITAIRGIARDIQTRSTDVSTCDRLSAVESELSRLSGIVAKLVKTDEETHEVLENVVAAETAEAIAEAVSQKPYAEASQ